MKRILLILAAMLLATPAFAQAEGSVTPGTAAMRSWLAGCYRQGTITPSVAQQMGLSCDANGALIISGTISVDTSLLATAANQVITNTDLGPPGATACATDTGSCSLNALLQRIAQRLTSAIAGTAVTQSGTWTVQPGNTANTTPWLVTQSPSTSGGLSTYSGNVTTAGSGAGVGGVAVDVNPGQLYGYQIWNGNGTVCYIQIFDQTQALTNLGTTTPKKSIGIPALGGANLEFPIGVPFATAITIGATTTRAGSTACGTGLDINIDYK